MLCVYSLKIAAQCCRKLLIPNELAENSSACRQDSYDLRIYDFHFLMILVASKHNFYDAKHKILYALPSLSRLKDDVSALL